MVQYWSVEDEEKPRFAMCYASIDDLRDRYCSSSCHAPWVNAMVKCVRSYFGRFGPYVRLGSTYASLTPEDDPLAIDLARAVELIDLKKIAKRHA